MTEPLKPFNISGVLLIVAYALLGSALVLKNGHYAPSALGLLIASFACTVSACIRRDTREPGRVALLACIGAFLVMNALAPPGKHLSSMWYGPTYRGCCLVLLLVAAIMHVTKSRLILIIRRMLIGIAVLGAIFFRVMMPIASPAPRIDVHSLSQQAADALLQGRNPYTEPMRDVYQGRATFVTPEHYAYPPANLYLQTMARFAFGDVRYISVAAELLVVVLLYRIARKRWSPPSADLLPLLFLFNPRGLFVIEQAWTEPILLAAFAVFVMLQLQGKRTAAAVTYGYLLSLKQYLLYFALEWLIIERRLSRILLGLSVVAITAAPLAWWEFSSFWEQAVLFNVTSTGFRRDSLSITSALYPLIGPMSKSLSIIVGAVAAVWSFIAMRNRGLEGYCCAVTISTYAMFLFGSQGFCNYYYFVGGLLLFTVLLRTDAQCSASARRAMPEGTPIHHLRK